MMGGGEQLNYLLRLRGSSSGIVDLAGNTITNYNVDYTSTPSSLGGGPALKFNGSNAYLEYKIKDDLLLTDDFTISLQIRNAGISVSSQAQIYFNGIDGQYNFQYENIRVPSFHLYHFYNNAAINIDKMGWAV